jgi:hypothetical protein
MSINNIVEMRGINAMSFSSFLVCLIMAYIGILKNTNQEISHKLYCMDNNKKIKVLARSKIK